MKYSDHFATHSTEYSLFRPDYPLELYQFLSDQCVKHDVAWDCATGTGQAAAVLSQFFKQVIATDINQAQLDAAMHKKNIQYDCCPAEKTNIPDHSVDLITVAQALHWFNFNEFYKEVKRVAKPEALFAAWCYPLGKFNSKLDELIVKLYDGILGNEYWPIERRYIDHAFQTIPFPFEKLNTPNFFIHKKMNFSQLIGYLNTWSAVKEYEKRNQKNPLELIYADLKNEWGDSEQEYIMHWPIHLLTGYVK